MPQQFPGGSIVVLNGFPGTGKLTILKEAKKLLPDTTCLLDNHLLIDPVATIIPDRCDEHHELRRMIRKPIFQTLRQRAENGHTILMTECLANNDTDKGVFEEYLSIVRGTKIPLFWVTVRCEQAVLEKRIGSSERCQGSKTKLVDLDALRYLLFNHRLIEPSENSDGLVVESLDANGSVQQSADLLLSKIRCR